MKRTTKQSLDTAFRELLQWEAKEQALLALRVETNRWIDLWKIERRKAIDSGGFGAIGLLWKDWKTKGWDKNLTKIDGPDTRRFLRWMQKYGS